MKPTVPLLAILMATLLLDSPISHAESLDDWGDWGMDADRFILRQTTAPEDQQAAHRTAEPAPLDAREQALFRALDNSNLRDYPATADSQHRPAQRSLLEQLEQLEQRYSAERIADALLDYGFGTQGHDGGQRFRDALARLTPDRGQLIELIESGLETGQLLSDMPAHFLDNRPALIDTLTAAGLSVDVMARQPMTDVRIDDKLLTLLEAAEAVQKDVEPAADLTEAVQHTDVMDEGTIFEADSGSDGDRFSNEENL